MGQRLLFCVTCNLSDRLCGLVVRVLGYRPRGPGSIPCATRFSEKYYVWNGAHSASEYIEEPLERKIKGSSLEYRDYGRRGKRRADYATLFMRKSWH
jgi:hypothetical protein